MTERSGARAKARGAWPVRKYRMGEEPSEDLRSSTTVDERLAMMWPLALEAWSLTGQPVPVLPRAQWPVRRATRRPERP